MAKIVLSDCDKMVRKALLQVKPQKRAQDTAMLKL